MSAIVSLVFFRGIRYNNFMKKFFTVLGCLLGFCVIVVLCYFFGAPKGHIEILTGKYYLVEMNETTEEKILSTIEYADSELYLEVYEDGSIKSFSAQTGMLQDDILYKTEVLGTGLTIKDQEKVKYYGYYAEEMITIIFEEDRKIDGEETRVLIQYVYVLK